MQFINKRSRTLAVPLTAAAGAAVDVQDLVSMRLSFAGTFDASYEIEVSYDKGTSFVLYGTLQVDAAFESAIPDAATQVRIRCTEYTSGTPVCALAGVPMVAGH
jgi:hypothetical protein